MIWKLLKITHIYYYKNHKYNNSAFKKYKIHLLEQIERSYGLKNIVIALLLNDFFFFFSEEKYNILPRSLIMNV